MVEDERMGRSGIRQAMNLDAINRASRFEMPDEPGRSRTRAARKWLEVNAPRIGKFDIKHQH